ncbi:fasciclin domain-containing protein [Deminuibacter soli]|uniref:Uncharacterized protein n=1 Tax=Deminuibacter soli TaxID=2291815 RepID=A0A3E1NIU5_9BACT|nr:fasciclin domain-containing protein [Deminuibacter soli]RFM27866.1 hypothetical protein DXN05_14325 [Deminuibacter soli]
MRNYFHHYITALAVALVCFSSCKKDSYITGGVPSVTKVNMTTYDYLAANSFQLFDTVLLLIDKAGLKDAVNQPGTTFFAPTDGAVLLYLQNQTLVGQSKQGLTYKYTLDSLLSNGLQTVKDSMKLYLFNKTIAYGDLTNDGDIFQTAAGNNVVLSYEYTKDVNQGYNNNVSGQPQLLYYTMLWQPLQPPFVASDIPDETGYRVICQTTGVQTTNGTLNVLYLHPLFFSGIKR